MSTQKSRPQKENTSAKFDLLDVYNNPKKYEFKCESVLIIPELKIYDKTSNKLVSKLSNIRLMKHVGTMDPNYSDTFFDMVEKESIPVFAQMVRESLQKKVK